MESNFNAKDYHVPPIQLAKAIEVAMNSYVHACMSGWLDSVLSVNDHGRKNDPEFVKSLLTQPKILEMAKDMVVAFQTIIHNDVRLNRDIPEKTWHFIRNTILEKLDNLYDTRHYRFTELLDTSILGGPDTDGAHAILSICQIVFAAYGLGLKLSDTDNNVILSSSVNAVLFIAFAYLFNNRRMEIPTDKNGLSNLSYLSLFQHALSDKSLVPVVERAVATAYYQMHSPPSFNQRPAHRHELLLARALHLHHRRRHLHFAPLV